MDFPPQRSLITDFGSSFMDSLLLLNARWQEEGKNKRGGEEAFGSKAASSTQQRGADAAEWFQPTGGGRQLGLSRPGRTETVNTAMPPALLSGTVAGWRGGGARGLTSRYPPVSLNEQKSFLLSLGLGLMCARISEFNYHSLLATPVISPRCSHML